MIIAISSQKISLKKDIVQDVDIDASSLTIAMYGKARLDTIEKIPVVFGVSVKSILNLCAMK